MSSENVPSKMVEPTPGELEAKETAQEMRTHPYERWVILAITSVGALLASIQSSALVVAFSSLVVALNADLTTIIWVLLSFLLACSAMTILTGKLGDVFGQANLFKFGFVVFTIACLLSGFAQKSAAGSDLIAYRALMGLGATFLFTNSAAIVTNAFAPFNQVGISTGVFQLAFAAGSVLGPVVGGGFASVDWRWIFWLNVPLMGIASILAIWLVKSNQSLTSNGFFHIIQHFDWFGVLFVFGFIILIMLAFTQAIIADPVLGSTAGITCLSVFGVFCLIMFFLNERYWAVDPLINLSIFNNKTFVLSTISGTIVGLARANVTYGMIFFLQGPRGQDPLNAGIQLIPFGLGIVITGILSGFLTDRIGVRNLSVVGPIVAIAGVFGLAFSTRDTNFWLIAFALLVVGFGSGLFNSPNNVAGMLSVPAKMRGIAAGIRLLLTFMAQMIGIIITFAFILNSVPEQELLVLFIYGGGNLSLAAVASLTKATQNVFWITLACFAAGAIISAFIPASFSVRALQPPAEVIKEAPIQLAEVVTQKDSQEDDAPKETAAVAVDKELTDVELA